MVADPKQDNVVSLDELFAENERDALLKEAEYARGLVLAAGGDPREIEGQMRELQAIPKGMMTMNKIADIKAAIHEASAKATTGGKSSSEKILNAEAALNARIAEEYDKLNAGIYAGKGLDLETYSLVRQTLLQTHPELDMFTAANITLQESGDSGLATDIRISALAAGSETGQEQYSELRDQYRTQFADVREGLRDIVGSGAGTSLERAALIDPLNEITRDYNQLRYYYPENLEEATAHFTRINELLATYNDPDSRLSAAERETLLQEISTASWDLSAYMQEYADEALDHSRETIAASMGSASPFGEPGDAERTALRDEYGIDLDLIEGDLMALSQDTAIMARVDAARAGDLAAAQENLAHAQAENDTVAIARFEAEIVAVSEKDPLLYIREMQARETLDVLNGNQVNQTTAYEQAHIDLGNALHEDERMLALNNGQPMEYDDFIERVYSENGYFESLPPDIQAAMRVVQVHDTSRGRLAIEHMSEAFTKTPQLYETLLQSIEQGSPSLSELEAMMGVEENSLQPFTHLLSDPGNKELRREFFAAVQQVQSPDAAEKEAALARINEMLEQGMQTQLATEENRVVMNVKFAEKTDAMKEAAQEKQPLDTGKKEEPEDPLKAAFAKFPPDDAGLKTLLASNSQETAIVAEEADKATQLAQLPAAPQQENTTLLQH